MVLARTGQALAGAGLAIMLALAAGCGRDVEEPPETKASPSDDVTTAPPAPEVTVSVHVDEDGSFVQEGTAPVRIDVASLDGGEIGVAPGWGEEEAMDFPPFKRSGKYPRAVLMVSNTDITADPLAPGRRDFSWGAEFTVAALSSGSPSDNGDNLVQRGISTYPQFFKAEVDGGRAACTVRGRLGEAYVRNYVVLQPGVWYRLQCTRNGDVVSATVTELGPSGAGRPVVVSVTEPTGSVDFADPTTPLIVGGKVGADGQVLSGATDQFNGRVLAPVLAIAE